MEIETSKGMVEESLLVKTEGGFENDVERTTWEEWRLDGELVKRNAHVRLKQPAVFAEAIAGNVG